MVTYGKGVQRITSCAVAILVALTGAHAGTAAPKTVRVMALGDSVTDGLTLPDGTPGAYRNDLWQLLKSDGYSVDFVGSRMSGLPTLGDSDHEGHPGWTIAQINEHAGAWMRTYQPDVVLLHLGTDDIEGTSTPEAASTALSTLVDTLTANAPAAQIFVSTLIPSPSDVLNQQFVAFNKLVPGIVARKGTRVHLVDMYSALSPADFVDPLHPTGGGYARMAVRWYSALLGVPIGRFEAEDGSLSNTATVQEATASGGVKVQALTTTGSSLILHYSVPKSGDQRIYIRAANATGAACDQQVWGKNGVPITVTYAGFADANLWATAAVTVAADAGENTFTFAGGTCKTDIAVPVALFAGWAGGGLHRARVAVLAVAP
jgi:lysophospholipase L1-like esterase